MYKRDCLDHARLQIAKTNNADSFKITRTSFNWNKYHYNPELHLEVHTTFLVWNQYFELYKRKEIRSLKTIYTNFAKKCMKNNGKCVVSIKPGYDF